MAFSGKNNTKEGLLFLCVRSFITVLKLELQSHRLLNDENNQYLEP